MSRPPIEINGTLYQYNQATAKARWNAINELIEAHHDEFDELVMRHRAQFGLPPESTHASLLKRIRDLERQLAEKS